MLDVSIKYSGQVDTSDLVGYPHGKAKNVGTFGDGTGTPYEKDLVNDIFGLQQSLLANAGITPSGVPDKVGASQQLDAIKFVAERSHREFNVTTFGALINGADDTAAFQACVSALAASGGGKVVVPYGATGVLKLTAKTVLPRGVSIYFVPGVQLLFDHATQDVFSWEATSATGRGPDTIENVWVEGAQTNNGAVFKISTYTELIFRNCRANSTDAKMAGKLFHATSTCDVTIDNCYGLAPAGSNDWVLNTSGKLTLRKTLFYVGAAFASRIVSSLGGELTLDGARFDLIGGATGSSTVCVNVAGGSLQVSGGTKFVDDTSTKTAIKFADDLNINVDQSTEFINFVQPYLPASAAVASLGSKLKLLPHWGESISGTTYTFTTQAEALSLESTNIAPPAIVNRKPLFKGDAVDVAVRNNSGSTWATTISFDHSSGGYVFADTSSLAGLQNGFAFAFRLVAIQLTTAIAGQTLVWAIVGAPMKLSLLY